MAKTIYMFVITVGFLIIGISQRAIANEESNMMVVLENFKKSLNWADSVSMKVDTSITPKGIPDKGPSKLVYILHRDHNRIEWNGNGFMPDSNGNPIPGKNATIKIIITDREYIDITAAPGFPPSRATITTDFNEKKENLLDDDEFGGPLFGKIFGANHKSVVDLLSESSDIHIQQEQEDVCGASCYVLEGTTKYGKVTAWIAPDKGYAALKWTVEKTGDHLINGTPISKTEMILWSAQFECKEIRQIGTYFIPIKATYDFAVKLKDGSNGSVYFFYTISDIQLNPDFNALGAFKIDLPEGTRVTVPESPGIRHIWKGGKVVADVNGSTFDEIDKTIDGLKQ